MGGTIEIQKMKLDLLHNIAIFVEVAQTKSFSRTSEILGMPKSSVSRRIAQLEKTLGLQLLNRTTRKIELTEYGKRYLQECLPILEQAEIAHEKLKQVREVPKGHLRISTPVDLALIWITPFLGEFSKLYPEITMDLDLSPRSVDLISEHYDIAIRIGKLPDSGLIVKHLASFPCFLFACPAYFENCDELTSPKQLQHHEFICVGKKREMPLTLVNGKDKIKMNVNGRFSLNNISAAIQLAASGLGIIVISEFMVKKEIETGKLVRILPAWNVAPVSVSALTTTRLLPAKTRVFLEFIAEKITK